MRVLPGPDVGALFALVDLVALALFGVDELDVALVLLGRLVHELKDTLRAGGGGDDKVDLHGELGYGVGEAAVQADEGHDRAQGDAANTVDGEDGADDGADDVAQPADIGVDGHEQVGKGIGLGGALAQGFIDLVESGLCLFLMAEDLDDLLSVHHLLDVAVELAEVALLLDVILGGELGELPRYVEHEHSREQADDGENGTQDHHGYKGGDHGDGRVDGLRYGLAHQLAQRVDVVGVDAHDVAVGVGVKILYGQRLHVREQVVAQGAHGALAHVDHQAVVEVRGQHAGGHDADKPYNLVEQLGEQVGPGLHHGLYVVVYQSLREGGADDGADSVDDDAADDKQEGPLVVREHVLYYAVEQGKRALDVTAA